MPTPAQHAEAVASQADLTQQPRLPEEFEEKGTEKFVLEVRRPHLLEDTLRAISSSSKGLLLRPLKVQFVGEPGVDEGGLTKEFFQLLIESLFDENYGMFVFNAEARRFWFAPRVPDVGSKASDGSAGASAGASSSPDKPPPPTSEYVEFFLVGLVLGLAVHNGQILDLKFPAALFRKLLSLPVTFKHLEEVDPELHRGLQQLLTFEGDVESTYLTDFTSTEPAFGAVNVVELKEGGADIPVTNTNRDEYVRLVTKYKLDEACRVQFDAFQKGFLAMCDGPAFTFVGAEELEHLICGEPTLDFKALEKNTTYDNWPPRSPVPKWFWEVVHSLSPEEQAQLLLFATGSDRAPVGGLGKLRFVLQKTGPDSPSLPVAHTCFNMLSIPEYASKDKLRERLMIAIKNAKGFGLL